MSKNKSNILAIGIMFFLFAMISFVTGLQNPFGIVVKNQFEASNAMSQLGNAANFIAYAFLGLPAGFLLKRKGYKFTALAAVAVGFLGVGILYLSGVVENFTVYLIGAFVSGFSMCMLNTVVNPMLNTLGGGGNRGNQLIQLGGSINSLAATICPVFVGYLIGDAAKAKISDADPALFIAMGIFVLAFVIILFSHIPEPDLDAAKENKSETKSEGTMTSIKGALSHRNFVFGIIAIFLYVGVEVGIPNTMNNYLTTKSKVQLDEMLKQNDTISTNLGYITINQKDTVVTPELEQYLDSCYNNDTKLKDKPTLVKVDAYLTSLYEGKQVKKDSMNISGLKNAIAKENKECTKNIEDPEYKEGRGLNTDTAGAVVAIYWFLMLIGRLIGGAIGGKVSSRVMISTVSFVAMAFVTVGLLLPETSLVKFPSLDAETFTFQMVDIPVGIMLFVLCGLCTSVMWGAIFNLAVEGLGKYTSIASGLFMVMVCGGGIVPLIQGGVVDAAGFMNSYWVLVAALAFILWFGLVGSKVKK